jgi:hypothetical protein
MGLHFGKRRGLVFLRGLIPGYITRARVAELQTSGLAGLKSLQRRVQKSESREDQSRGTRELRKLRRREVTTSENTPGLRRLVCVCFTVNCEV